MIRKESLFSFFWEDLESENTLILLLISLFFVKTSFYLYFVYVCVSDFVYFIIICG